MKLICPFVSSTAQRTSVERVRAGSWRAAAASSSSVIRFRLRLRSIGLPSSTTITGSPSSAGRRRGKRKLAYETPTVSSPIVPPTSRAPVTEKSFWVTPCCTRSPIITSMIRSKGWSEESSRRPMIRVSR